MNCSEPQVLKFQLRNFIVAVKLINLFNEEARESSLSERMMLSATQRFSLVSHTSPVTCFASESVIVL
jgi:hypothetical protein